jgi:hypothetical protein
MKNLRKTLASIAIMAALVAGCQTNSPTPEVVVVKKPDPITPADTTKKDTTKVVVIPPTPVSPKVIAGQKCYEAKVVLVTLCGSVVVQVLNDSIGINTTIGVSGSMDLKYLPVERLFNNVIMLKVPNKDAFNLWTSSGKVYFTVKEFIDLSSFNINNRNADYGWGSLTGNCHQYISGMAKVPYKGAILSSYSTESCKP